MDFELQTLGLVGAASDKADALVVLVSEGFTPGRDPLSMVIATARKHGDLETQPGKLLTLYRVPSIAVPRVLLAGVGDGGARAVRQALLAAVSSLKGITVKRLLVVFSG